MNDEVDLKGVVQLHGIQNTPLRSQIAELLREAIVRGDFRPGQALTEVSLAQQLKVSRAPVREAIRILAKEGLLESVPYKGTSVRSLSPRDIEETYSLRELLETFALERIIKRAEPVSVAALEAICEAMQRAAVQGDLHALSVEDERFHRAVIELAQHELLASLWGTVSLRVRQIMALRNRQNRNLMEVALNHPPIVEAIRTRNLPRARALIHRHVLSAADISLEGWAFSAQEGAA